MPTSPVVDLSNSYGAVFIGFIVCLALFGLTLAQTWMYFWHCWNRDTKKLKSFISFIIIMETVQTVTIVYSIYWYLVLNFSNVEALATIKWFFLIQGNFGGFYINAIQWYYARQIYLLSKKIYPAIIIVTLTIIGTVLNLYDLIIELAAEKFSRSQKSDDVKWVEIVGLVENVVVDFLITGFMCWALYHKRTGFAKTDSVVKTLMAYTINTGLLTSILTVATLFTLILSPRSMIPLAVYFPMGKCYVNSVLAMLNSRDYIRVRASPENSGNSFALTSIRIAPPSEAFGSQSKQTDISVIVRRSTASTHAQNKIDPKMGHAFEGPKLASLLNAKIESRLSKL